MKGIQVYKFGGASVKDAIAVQNVARIVQQEGATGKLVVISAMGKTTNALENVVWAYFNEKENLDEYITERIRFHESILTTLFPKGHQVYQKVVALFDEMKHFLRSNKSPQYDFVYDQAVSYGELISTTIVCDYLEHIGIPATWIDARELIKTDRNYRGARVLWEETQKRIKQHIDPKKLNITQGFIGADAHNFTTTLGREGSDYTGGIFAYCLNAESLTIWKDVPGVLNGDPKVFDNTLLLRQISYEETIELAFYGASVIHPKTLQPLQRKEIPLFVKSFANPENPGTVVGNGEPIVPLLPCYIVKENQVLLSIASLDFSFMMEDNIGEIFRLLGEYKMKVDLIQNSAISFSVCISDKFNNLETLVDQLKGKFKVTVTKGVSLFTIRHATPKALTYIEKGRQILLKQIAQDTVQLITTN